MGSKVAAGATVSPGIVEWKGMYAYLTELGVRRGMLIEEALEIPKFMGKVTGVAGALVNVALLQTQVASRRAVVKMEGDGPLVRTKTTSHGQARTISVLIEYGSGDPDQVRARNCMLAALGLAGNNAQQVLGRAANVQVEISGANGFANGLAAGDSIVLFGPETFHPIQTADSEGRITFQVQGRRQKEDKSHVETSVQKEFSVFLEASLDPAEASQIGRSFADDLLCTGMLLAGDAVDAAAECQNSVIDIVKQFHWDLGEYSFPLTDWEEGAWLIDGQLGPYRATMIKCGGVGGTWDIYIEGNFDGAEFSGTVAGDIDQATGTGTFVLSGEAVGYGLTIPVSGTLTGTFVQDSETTGTLTLNGPVNGVDGGASAPVTRTTCDPA